MKVTKIPQNIGVCTIVTGKNGFNLRIIESGKEGRSVSLLENQTRILRKLNEAPEGLIATEIAESLDLTPAGVLYLLKPLIEKNIVVRSPLKGGGVLYFMQYDIKKEELTPELEAYLKEIKSTLGKKIEELSIEELLDYLERLPDNDRRAIIKWVVEGTWRRYK